MPPAKRKPRTYDPVRTWNALMAQAGHVREAAHALKPEQLAIPSGLPGRDVRQLLAHLVRQLDAVPLLLAQPAPPARAAVTGLDAWAVSPAPTGGDVPEAGGDPAVALDAAVGRLAGCEAEAVRAGRTVPHASTAMRALDFTVTRLVELVVHSDDLARATGLAVPLDRQALAATVRVLADALAVKAPGGSVEVRIPPYAVVQCVEGPRHTRGTPPNVVETDPLTWIRLASGRARWTDERDAARVRASGERADIGGLLPVRVAP